MEAFNLFSMILKEKIKKKEDDQKSKQSSPLTKYKQYHFDINRRNFRHPAFIFRAVNPISILGWCSVSISTESEKRVNLRYPIQGK